MSYIDKKQLVKLVSYMATFDGGLYKRSTNSNAMFIMNMREENRDYIEWVKATLEQVTSCRLSNRKDYNTDGWNRNPQLRLESRCHPFFTSIWGRIYTAKSGKIIDPHMLKLMDAEALAIIFMCDGGSRIYKANRSVNFSTDISLNTKGFGYHDNLALSKSIFSKLHIKSIINRHNQYWYLRINTKDHQRFVDTVKPYIKPSFFYKLERLAPKILI